MFVTQMLVEKWPLVAVVCWKSALTLVYFGDSYKMCKCNCGFAETYSANIFSKLWCVKWVEFPFKCVCSCVDDGGCCHCGSIKHTPCGAMTQRSPASLSVTTEEALQRLFVPFLHTSRCDAVRFGFAWLSNVISSDYLLCNPHVYSLYIFL